MLNCLLHQLLGMEQEQEQSQHWDKCPHLVLQLPAVLVWSPTSQGLKKQWICLVNPSTLLVLLTHPQGPWLAPCLWQRHQ